MAEIDVLKAQLVRDGPHTPWGFRLMGGVDVRAPLIIQSIAGGSPAARIGLKPGDEVSEIGDALTKHMTHERASKVIGQYGTTMILTVERSAYGSVPAHPTIMNPAAGADEGYDARPRNPPYQQPRDFQRAQARPFEAPQRPNPPPPPPPEPQPEYRPQQQFSPQCHYETLGPLRAENENLGGPTQSGVFNTLASLMANEEPAAGSQGLPPPRSAYQERMRAEGQQHGSPRVKVFMPQQYNTPLGMYSAQNVVETFQGQAERQLENLESKQPDVYSGAHRAVIEEDHYGPPSTSDF